MSASFVGAGSVVATTGTAAPDVHASTAPNTDVILAIGQYDNGALTVPTPSGYEELGARGTAHKVFGRIATGSDACSFGSVGATFMAQTLTYRGLLADLVNILDASYPQSSSVSSTNARLPAASAPVKGGCLLFFSVRSQEAWTSIASPSTNAGWTKRTDQTYGGGTSHSLAVFDSIQTSPVAISQEDIAITGSVSGTQTGVLLALNAAITLLERLHRGMNRGMNRGMQ